MLYVPLAWAGAAGARRLVLYLWSGPVTPRAPVGAVPLVGSVPPVAAVPLARAGAAVRAGGRGVTARSRDSVCLYGVRAAREPRSPALPGRRRPFSIVGAMCTSLKLISLESTR